MLKEETVCITGHRPKNLPWGYDEKKVNCIRFKKDLCTVFTGAIKYGLKNFMIGMAEGFDMISCEILLSLRKKYKELKIIAVIPCKNQEIKWKPEQQKRYNYLLKKVNNIIIIQNDYSPNCMNKRNHFMVNNSSVVIACYNGKPSGTGNTIRYAQKNACKIKIIDINKYE